MEDTAQLLDDAVQWIYDSYLPPQERLLIILLLRNGLRVSEIANPAGIRKIDDWSVSVFCYKTKIWRICQLAEAAYIEKEYKVLENIGMWKRNRFYYYRKLKGLLPNIETSRTGNQAVTHAARNIRAQQTYEATGEMDAAKTALGHKSVKSTETYVKQRRRGAKVLKGVEGDASGTINDIQLTRNGVLRSARRK